MSDRRDAASDRLRELLRDDERLRWRGRPLRRRLLADVVRLVVPVLVVVSMVGVFVTWMVGLAVEFRGGDPTAVFPAVGAGAVLVVLLVVLAGLWVANRRYERAEYAATDRRLVSLTGAFGRDTSTVDWGSVRDLEVSVGALDGLFGTGTVRVATGGDGGVALRYLERPHEVASRLDSIRSAADPTGESRAADAPVAGPAPQSTTEPDRGQGGVAGTGSAAGPTRRREWGTREAERGAADVSATLEGLLRDGEALLWHYRPPERMLLAEYVVRGLLSGLLVATVFFGFAVGLPLYLEFRPAVESALGVDALAAIAAGWVAVLLLWTLALVGGAYRVSGRLEFAATDRRAIKVGGMVGPATSSVEWRHVTDVELDRILVSKLFGTAAVVVRSGGDGSTARGGGVRFGPVADPETALARVEAVRRGETDGAPILVGRTRSTGPAVDAPDPGALSPGARRMLRDGEALHWAGSPALLPFAGPAVVGGAALAAAGVFLRSNGWGLFAVFLVLVGAGTAAKRLLHYRNAEYVATDERVLSFGGALGRDASSVDWADVRDVEVRTGPFDGPFGTGTLRFSRAGAATPAERRRTGGEDRSPFTGVRFQRVPDAHAVAETLERRRDD